MHAQTHVQRSKECYGCCKKYAFDSAILDHLEYDTCPSGVTLANINRWAFECYQHRYHTHNWGDEYQYRCPRNHDNFKYVSALLRHTESPTCGASQERCIQKMKAYIEKKVRGFESLASL
ncbi:hypothetical protein V8C42DRAFT_336616 [Trichoderma barbatum]